MALQGPHQKWPHIRKHDRVQHGESTAFKPSVGGLQEGIVRDVGEGGLFLVSDVQLPVGTRMTIYLPLLLSKKKTLCLLSGRVVRLSGPREAQGFGVQFDSTLPSATHETLREFVELSTAPFHSL